ncbi:DISARM system SNF2-like helicase DrmD [Actinoplanes aureus]|uniref:Helicase n=1 Tax=Actinoplanes aureus TaxID=2792083 RepID=A0A931CE92_9ACTN|nr:DISARM system SNF2-like helicase DrmD [Actinoplanes aureus]MBG0564941.1 helicase [Actinoplanes aureus]
MPATTAPPADGQLVSVRGRRWVVNNVEPGAKSTLVSLQSVEDGRYADTLDVIWEVEAGAQVLPTGALPPVEAGRFDPPHRLAAFLDAVRWSAVTSADVRTLQAPFRSGVAIEDYQLEPVARAVDAPRVNLLLADDVGLGKTIEAGLVAQELLLRHRARRIMIVCPAGLTIKWRDEMLEKFGLDFTVVDSERAAAVRRTHGSSANPFHVYPLTIVSLPWLRGPKAQRLLDEVLPADGPAVPRTFDLLILDEAHHVAPAAPRQVYAVDSQQTKLIRKIAPHFTHRLFLSATPHNGYPESFRALLELIDDQRFLRSVEPDPAAVRETVVRRLKRHIENADGTPRFVERVASAIPVEYPPEEREIHALLTRFAELRRERLETERGRKATDLITLLLKKRLFSSPAAFAHTVGVYLRTLRGRAGAGPLTGVDDDIPEWMEDFVDDLATYDDEQLAEAEDDALERMVAADDEESLLERMLTWAQAQQARPDAKAAKLIDYLKSVCKPDGRHWTNERVLVFTEYRDTQSWLADLLRRDGLAGPAVATLHGGTPTGEREQLRLAFQADPAEHPVRILLATDAASEGVDLQNHCHRLVNYDIPFNPNKLEQRIGRVDRYGQTTAPDIRHFVGTGFAGDLEFLSRIATKIAAMEADLGAVNAVISEAVRRRMAGERVSLDLDEVGRKVRAEELPTEPDTREQVRRLRADLDRTVEELGISPPRVKRVVDTALELARQRKLRPHTDDKHLVEGLYTVPPLTGSRPITFDAEVIKGRDGIVLAHLNHPLVAMSTRLLRASVSNPDLGLHRVTAVVSDDPDVEDVLVGAYSRFVLVGAGGVRLHEEILCSGGWVPDRGRFRRVENPSTLGGILDHALTRGVPATDVVRSRVAGRWERIAGDLGAAVKWAAGIREEVLHRRLEQRRQAERDRVNHDFDQFEAGLRRAIDADGPQAEATLFRRAEASRRTDELAQYRRDRTRRTERLSGLAGDRERELDAVGARYRKPVAHTVPVAVVFVVPQREASR